MREIKPLTTLRAFAATLVFLFHYAWQFPPASRGVEVGNEWIPLLPVWSQGQVGVSIFFVLSGFLITRIYFDPFVNKTASLRLYFVKRFARIWPLFLLFAVAQHMIDGEALSRASIVTLSMTQGFFKYLRYKGLQTAWSLSVEESFYFFAPMLIWLLGKFTSERGRADTAFTVGRFVRIAFTLLGIVIGMAALGEGIVRLVTGAHLDWRGFMGTRSHMLHTTIFGRFPEFAVGMLAAFVHRGVDMSKLLRGHRADVVSTMTFLTIGALLWAKSIAISGLAEFSTVVTLTLTYCITLLSGVLILSLCAGHGIVHRVLSLAPLVFLGRVSYGFYLIQVSALIVPLLTLTDRMGPARLPLLFVLTNLVCSLTYVIWEAPARRWIVARFGDSRAAQ